MVTNSDPRMSIEVKGLGDGELPNSERVLIMEGGRAVKQVDLPREQILAGKVKFGQVTSIAVSQNYAARNGFMGEQSYGTGSRITPKGLNG